MDFTLHYLRAISCCFLFFLPLSASAELVLPALISDHMVLQQHSRVKLWGRATPGSRVTARIAERQSEARTDAQGHWIMRLPQLPAGKHVLQLSEQYEGKTLSATQVEDVAVGEVWLAAGQSNMEWPLGRSDSAEQVPELLKSADLRFFVVSHQTALTPQSAVYGHWIKLNPDNALTFSGVAFHFAQQLQTAKQVPVGIIQSAWGSTKVQAWSNPDILRSEPVLQPLLNEMQQQLNLPDAEKARHEQALLDWEAENYLPDPGISPETARFSEPELDDSDWTVAELPVLFSGLNFLGDGAIWFRRHFTLADDEAIQDATLSLGMIDDFDQAFLNGVAIGQTDRNTAHHWLQPRHYRIDKALLKPGQNTLAIRVFDQYGDGGFTGRAKEIRLKTGQHTVSLAGRWKYKVSIDQPAQQADWASIPTPPFGLRNRNTPGVLYNAMITPLTDYRLQGVIWYQGESDAKQPEQYQVLFPAMIRQWRQVWQQDLPFLFVQLANFNLPGDDSQQSWTGIRAIQSDSAKQLPGTGMVSAIDVGEADNIHPKNKQAVGERLANLALATVYGELVDSRAPECDRAMRDQSQVILLGCHHAEGLHSSGAISAFEVAGAEGVFRPVEAAIDGGKLILRADNLTDIRVVRYAWHNNPVANIYNAARLPLRPFRLELQE